MGNPTSADFSRLASAHNENTRAIKALVDGVRALNTNLVAIHHILKEQQTDE